MTNAIQPKTKRTLKCLKCLKDQGFNLRECAEKLKLSYGSIKDLNQRYLLNSERREKRSAIIMDSVTRIVMLAQKNRETNQPYTYFIQKYHVRAPMAMKIAEQLQSLQIK